MPNLPFCCESAGTLPATQFIWIGLGNWISMIEGIPMQIWGAEPSLSALHSHTARNCWSAGDLCQIKRVKDAAARHSLVPTNQAANTVHDCPTDRGLVKWGGIEK